MEQHKLGGIAIVESRGVDKKIKDEEKGIRLCNFVDVYYNWAITLVQYFWIPTKWHTKNRTKTHRTFTPR